MKNLTNNKLAGAGFILALAMLVGSPVQAETAQPTDEKGVKESKTMANCNAMQEQKQKMLDDMKAQDAELTELLAKMNSAPEDKKVASMAAVINRMVEQRIAMDARKAKMEEMMQHHMQMGMGAMSGGMPQSPAMKDADKK